MNNVFRNYTKLVGLGIVVVARRIHLFGVRARRLVLDQLVAIVLAGRRVVAVVGTVLTGRRTSEPRKDAGSVRTERSAGATEDVARRRFAAGQAERIGGRDHQSILL